MINLYTLDEKSKKGIEKGTGLEIDILNALEGDILSFCVMNKKNVKVFLDDNNELKIRYKRKIFNQDELKKYLYKIRYASEPKRHLCHYEFVPTCC